MSASNDSAKVRRWTLEMRKPSQLNARFCQRSDVNVHRVEIPHPEFNRFLHDTIGRAFQWGGREDWTAEDWIKFVARDELETWVLYVRGTPAGYFEAEYFEDKSTRIHTFGLIAKFFGEGLGAHLLSFAVRRGFERGATRIWLRTCSRDHPHALPNYQARGFVIVADEEIYKPQ